MSIQLEHEHQASLRTRLAHRITFGFLQIFPKVSGVVKSDVNKLLKKNKQLNQLDSVKVISHVQRESGDWIKNTLMLEGYDVPFKYSRNKLYKNLQGASVNLTYYPQTELVAGLEFESMKVVRIRRS